MKTTKFCIIIKLIFSFLICISQKTDAQPNFVEIDNKLDEDQNHDIEAKQSILFKVRDSNPGISAEYDPDPNKSMLAHITEGYSNPSTTSYDPFPVAGTYNFDPNLPVGAIKGIVDVSPSGAATYNIPVFIPPGTNGMQPQISIVYNSQAGNGIMGVGWEVSGLSSIVHVGQTMYHDNNVSGVELLTNDRFSLDGIRLIYSGGYYHTETETYSQITANGTQGHGPVSFTVFAKDGRILEYGNTDDSRIEAPGNPYNNVYMWRLNKVSDRNGNYMNYYYKEEYGESVIDRIEYTGHDPGLSPYNTIKFFYETRADRNTYYVAGSGIPQTKILKSIRSISENKIVRDFQFDYAYDDLSSHLVNINETGSDQSKLNATEIYWGVPTSQFSQVQNTQFIGKKMIPGDFNGDGKTDLMVFGDYSNWTGSESYNIFISNGTSFTNVYGINFGIDDFQPELTRTGDFNGDGLDDILFCFYNSSNEQYDFRPALSNGSSIGSFLGPFLSQSSSANCCHSFNSFIADIDGNGINEVVISNRKFDDFPDQTSFAIYTYNIAAGSFNYWGNSSGPVVINDVEKYEVVDFNGNGKAEILAVYNANVPSGQTCKIFEYPNLNSAPIYTGGFPTRYHSLFPGDFNGDGKTDLITYSDYGNGTGDWHLNYSNGKDFWPEFTPPLIPNADPDGSTLNNNYIVRDFNGDGKDDILEAYLDLSGPSFDYNVHYSNGLGHFKTETLSISSSGIIIYTYFFNNPIRSSRLHFNDYNGDGKQDLFYKKSSNEHEFIFFHENEKRNLVTSVTNGLNLTTEFFYEPITTNAVYTKGSPPSFPLMAFQGAMYVVSQTKTPDGLLGKLTTNYSYENARIHRQGKGFLGFQSVTADNVTTGWKTKNEYENLSSNLHYALLHTWISKNSSPVSDAGYTNNYYVTTTNSYGKAYFPYVTPVVEHDALKGVTKTTNFSFHNTDGNMYHSEESYNPASKTVVTNNIFALKGGWGPANKIVHSDVTQTYDGQLQSYVRNIDYSYNSLTGNLEQESRDQGMDNEVVTQYGNFTNTGIPLTVTVSAPNSQIPLQSRVTNLNYDSKDRFIIKTTNPLSDFFTKSWNSDGTVSMETSIDNLITTYDYDGFGNVKETTTPEGNVITSELHWAQGTGPNHALYYSQTSLPGKPDATTYYDAIGRTLRIVTDGYNGLVTVDKQYNNKGQLIHESKPSYNTPNKWIDYYYTDPYDRLTDVTDNGRTVHTAYSNLTITTSCAQNPALYSQKIYNSVGDLMTSTDNNGETVSYTYHSNGKPLTIDAAGGTTTLHYDPYGRQDELHDPDAGFISYEYDAFGQLYTQTDANTNTYTFSYNTIGQSLTKTCSDGTVTTYTYVTNGYGKEKIASISCTGGISQSGTSQSYQYDKFGRVIQITDALPGKSMVTNYEYDNYGHVTKHTYPSGFSITNHYDQAKGFLTSITKNPGNAVIWTLNNENAYGQPVQFSFGNGLNTDFIYDSNDFLQSIKTGSGAVQDMSYSFDNFKGILLNRSRVHNGNTLSEDFTLPNQYDNLNQLRGYTSNTGQNVSVDIDANGNITKKSDACNSPNCLVYNNSQHLHAVSEMWNNAGTIPTTTQSMYPSYTPFNKIWHIEENNKTLDFTYGADEQRIKTVFKNNGNTVKTKYFSISYEEEEIPGQGTREINYISGSHGLCAIWIKDVSGNYKLYYVLKDHLGSIVGLVDASNGNLDEEYSFDAWGRRRNPATGAYLTAFSGPIDRGFTGHEHLDEFGLINMNGRLYDPLLGRMLSPDIYNQAPDFALAFNRYSYANNNPLKYTDPTGNTVVGELIAAVAIAMVVNVALNYKNIDNFGQAIGYAVIGGYAGAAGYGAGAAVGVGIGFFSGAASGASAGFAAGFVGGTGNSLIAGSSLEKAMKTGLVDGCYGALIGGVVGGVAGGIRADDLGYDFWSGGEKAKVYRSPVNDNFGELDGECYYRCLEEFSESFGLNQYDLKYWMDKNGGKLGIDDLSKVKSIIESSGTFSSDPIYSDANIIADSFTKNKRVLVTFNTEEGGQHAVMVKQVKIWPSGKYKVWFAETSRVRFAPHFTYNFFDLNGGVYWTFFIK